MSVRGDHLVSSIQECHIDLLIAQFFETSDEFREWFVSQVEPEVEILDYIGSACNVTKGRESDIEIGFRTTSGEEHIILIENKIKESEQPNQLQDYHKRGKRRVEQGDWDSFSVCLIAPDEWIAPATQGKVHELLRYEELIDKLDQIDHVASTFGTNLLIHGISESQEPVENYSTTLADIQSGLAEGIFDLADFDFDNRGKNLVIESRHTDHPDFARYWIYIAKPPTHTDLRLYFDVDNSRTRETIAHRVFREIHMQEPDMWKNFDNFPRNKNVAKKQISHDEYERFPDNLVETISTEMADLIQTVHPILTEMNFPEYE